MIHFGSPQQELAKHEVTTTITQPNGVQTVTTVTTYVEHKD